MWALGSHRNNQELWKQGNEKCINGGRGHLAIYYYINELANFCDEAAKICRTSLTLFRMGLFGTTHGWGRGQKEPLPKICHTYPTMMKLGTVIPYPKKIQKYIWITWHTPWVLLTSAFFHQKSANFAIWRNTDIDSFLIHLLKFSLSL